MIIFMGLLVMMNCTGQKVTTGYMVGEVMIICMVVLVMMSSSLMLLVKGIHLSWILINIRVKKIFCFYQRTLLHRQMSLFHVLNKPEIMLRQVLQEDGYISLIQRLRI